MNKPAFLCASICAICIEALGGDAFPRVWTSVTGGGDREEIFRLCAEQGIDCVDVGTGSVERCAKTLEALRRHGLKGFTGSGPNASMNARIRAADGGAAGGSGIFIVRYKLKPNATVIYMR